MLKYWQPTLQSLLYFSKLFKPIIAVLKSRNMRHEQDGQTNLMGELNLTACQNQLLCELSDYTMMGHNSENWFWDECGCCMRHARQPKERCYSCYLLGTLSLVLGYPEFIERKVSWKGKKFSQSFIPSLMEIQVSWCFN